MRRFVRFLIFAVVLSVSSTIFSELPSAPEGSFGIAVLPDTQRYLGKGTKAQPESTEEVTNAVFEAYSQWVADNLGQQRIAFVTHVGDIVDRNVPEQWEVARRNMDRLHRRVPYGIGVGNHDMAGSGDSSLFQKYFPASRFEGVSWYGGFFAGEREDPSISGSNANSYQLFSAAGLDFVFLHLECNAPDDVLAWADGILEQYADRRAIVTTHMYLGPVRKPTEGSGYFSDPKGRMLWKKRHGERGNTPQQMWDKCFRKHGNLSIVICGDQSRTQAMYQVSQGDRGNLVHEVMSDYGSNGLRIYRFLPAPNQIQVVTYNPMEQGLCESTKIVPDRGRHQFTISYDMSR